MKLSAQAVALALVAGSIAASADAGAKDGSGVPRVAFLTSGSETTLRTRVEALKRGLGELGYVEGQTIALEYRYADAKPERLLAIARELVGLKVAVIVAHGTPASLAVKQATSAIPIVILEVGDPVGARLASTLARPGGNVTGVAQIGIDLYGKQFEVLKEIFPRISKVAMLWNPANPAQVRVLKAAQTAGERLGISVQPLAVQASMELEKAVAIAAQNQVEALVVSRDPVFVGLLGQLMKLTERHRLPVIGGQRAVPQSGGLMAYGPDSADMARRAAIYVDKILKGANPSDLPIEQPTKFELVINTNAAKLLGLTIPPSVMLRVSEVIP